MDDDLDTPSSSGSLIKWPFYVANALILGTVISYLLNRRDAPLDNWEVATCVFAVALSAMLFFVPHLVEYFITISLPEKNDTSSDHGLLEKTYLEFKGLKEDLSDFGVKLEKVPAIVESISKETLAGNGDSRVLAKLEDELGSLRAQLEQASTTTPSEPDPRLTELIASVAALEKTIDRIAEDLADRPQPEPEGDDDHEPEGDDDHEPEGNLAKVDRILEETQSTDLEDEGQEDDDQEPEGDEKTEDENQTDEFDLGATADEVDNPDGESLSGDEAGTRDDENEGDDLAEEEELPDEDDETESEEPDGEDDQDDAPEDEEESEDELGEASEDELIAESAGVLKGVSQFEVVVAKILPGIGNKVHLRGEGPGLSWDKGVPMSFLEIGKWGWSPSDKSTSIVVQLYKNDEEPDGNGKVELEPGEKVEITPSFSA